MNPLKTACALLVASSLLFSGCYVRMGVRHKVVRTEDERKQVNGRIGADLRMQGQQAVLKLTQTGEAQVLTYDIIQQIERRFNLTGLVLGISIPVGTVGLLLFIILIIAASNSDGSGGSSHDWDDWD